MALGKRGFVRGGAAQIAGSVRAERRCRHRAYRWSGWRTSEERCLVRANLTGRCPSGSSWAAVQLSPRRARSGCRGSSGMGQRGRSVAWVRPLCESTVSSLRRPNRRSSAGWFPCSVRRTSIAARGIRRPPVRGNRSCDGAHRPDMANELMCADRSTT